MRTLLRILITLTAGAILVQPALASIDDNIWLATPAPQVRMTQMNSIHQTCNCGVCGAVPKSSTTKDYHRTNKSCVGCDRTVVRPWNMKSGGEINSR